MASEWAKRFYNSLYSKPMGFDGLGNLEKSLERKQLINKKKNEKEKEKERLGFRMDELKKRISDHAKIPAKLSLPSSYLAWWNKNPQCPPKTWDDLLSNKVRVTYKECKADSHKRICVKWYNTETYTFVFCFCKDPKLKDWKPGDKDLRCTAWESTSNQKSLILPRHNPYEKSLEIADYVSSYFPPRWPDAIIAYEGNTKQERYRNYGFWLIDEKYADFVYAILKSSMFRAWCELTACTWYRDSAKKKHKGNSHFTIGMWDTFPIRDIGKSLLEFGNLSPAIKALFPDNPTVEEAIKQAGQWLKNGWTQSVSFDDCMDELCVGRIPEGWSRKQILKRGFLEMFSSLKTDVMSLA